MPYDPTDALWTCGATVRVPAAVVTPEGATERRVLVPVTNFGSEPMTIRENEPLAALDEALEVSLPVMRAPTVGPEHTVPKGGF